MVHTSEQEGVFPMSEKRIAIIGGGAAGLTAAITAARAGAGVTVLEHMDRVGKKILATGNGRCNYTNAALAPERYFSGHPEVVRTILSQYPVERILSFFDELGVVAWQRDGYYYPASGQAAAVLDCLPAECERLSVELLCETKVQSITAKQKGNAPSFRIQTNRGNMSFDRVILACGGEASPVTGSDGSGYEAARSLGHRIQKTFPALTGLTADKKRFKSLAGIRARATVSLYIDGQLAATDTGELQLTENGVSGIVIFQISHPAIEAYQNRRKTEIHINFLPEIEDAQVFGYLKNRRELFGT